MILRSLRVILRSLRGRIVMGAFLWSVGLLVVVNVVSTATARVFPALRQIDVVLMSMAGTACAIAGLLIVGIGLRKLDGVRKRVDSLRAGEGQRLDEVNLAEIEPLVRDMNALLDHRERVVRRAVATAADLAHGLKTPLAIMAQEAERLDAAGHDESAATIAEQVERMRRQVEYHLARARASGAGATWAASTAIRPVVERLIRTVTRLSGGKSLEFAMEIGPWTVQCSTEELEEMLGNLLDNASRWAVGAVAVTASSHGPDVEILVEDDGPGIDPASRERVLQRGVRADEADAGSGLGLAIVSELAELCNGSIALDTAPGGGLRVRLTLPAGTPLESLPDRHDPTPSPTG